MWRKSLPRLKKKEKEEDTSQKALRDAHSHSELMNLLSNIFQQIFGITNSNKIFVSEFFHSLCILILSSLTFHLWKWNNNFTREIFIQAMWEERKLLSPTTELDIRIRFLSFFHQQLLFICHSGENQQKLISLFLIFLLLKKKEASEVSMLNLYPLGQNGRLNHAQSFP